MDIDTMITTYNTAVTDAASEILGKERRRKKPWVTKDCDKRRDLKKKRYKVEGEKEYREANRRIQKAVKKAKENWIGAQGEEIETCLNKTKRPQARCPPIYEMSVCGDYVYNKYVKKMSSKGWQIPSPPPF